MARNQVSGEVLQDAWTDVGTPQRLAHLDAELSPIHPAAQAFMSMSAEQKQTVHLRVCERALEVWEQHFPRGSVFTYRESVAGTTQELDVLLPTEALISIRNGRDLANIESRYREPIAALHDLDLELPDKAEFAYYAIYNAFNLYVCAKPMDEWLIVNQALSSVGENNAVRLFEEATKI